MTNCATVVRIAFARGVATKKGRCRSHGGASGSGAPSGERNGQYALEDAKRIEFDCGAALEIFHLRVPSRLGRSRLIAEGLFRLASKPVLLVAIAG